MDVCMCVRERERESKCECGVYECVCVCVCMCVCVCVCVSKASLSTKKKKIVSSSLAFPSNTDPCSATLLIFFIWHSAYILRTDFQSTCSNAAGIPARLDQGVATFAFRTPFRRPWAHTDLQYTYVVSLITLNFFKSSGMVLTYGHRQLNRVLQSTVCHRQIETVPFFSRPVQSLISPLSVIWVDEFLFQMVGG